ncbi:MAG: hypothetical protein IJP66_00430, partial [Kiritimatiellae bacterium]|nr:hypothetical protein [Kiritimatiellia bacterium]
AWRRMKSRARLTRSPDRLTSQVESRSVNPATPARNADGSGANPRFDEPADIQADAGGTIHARRIQPPSGARVAFDIPLRGGGSILMTDYASADCWDGSRIRTWIAKPVGVA